MSPLPAAGASYTGVVCAEARIRRDDCILTPGAVEGADHKAKRPTVLAPRIGGASAETGMSDWSQDTSPLGRGIFLTGLDSE